MEFPRRRLPENTDITEELVQTLVHRFYDHIRADSDLGPIFNSAVKDDWGNHLGKMCEFWSSVMLMSGRYHGNPMITHMKLKAVRPEHFERWLELFREAARDTCSPEVAARFVSRAENIANSLKLDMFYRPERRGSFPTAIAVNTPHNFHAPAPLTPPANDGTAPPLVAVTRQRAGRVVQHMHPAIYRIAFACWVFFLATFWVTFWVSAHALFMVVIGTVYAAVFFGVPYLMSRQAPRDIHSPSLAEFMHRDVATFYGPIRGRDALVQVVLVPAVLSIGCVAIGIIIRMARTATLSP